MEMTDELSAKLKAELAAYRKELEALSADELMTRYHDECYSYDNDCKFQDGKFWYKHFENVEFDWDYEWEVVYDGHDPSDREYVIEDIMKSIKRRMQRELTQRELTQHCEKPAQEPAMPKAEKEHEIQQSFRKPTEDQKLTEDQKFGTGLIILFVVGMIIALIIGFAGL